MGQDKVAESFEIFSAVEMVEDMLAGRAAKCAEHGLEMLEQLNSCNKAFQRTWAIKKTVRAVQHQFRDTSDRGREHWFTARHCFH